MEHKIMVNHQPSNQEQPSMNDNALEDLKVELQLKEAQYQWMKAQLTQMVKEIIGSEENLPMHIDYQMQAIARNAFRKAAIERARKYGLEIEQYER